MGFRVLKGGMLATVQDLGRTGYQSQGFSVSGVMDVRSFKIANLLLDNPENEAVLEFTLMGPSLEFTSETIIAITGGDFQPRVNKKPVKMYTALYMHKGDVLDFAGCRTGSRGYIAFSSYLDIPGRHGKPFDEYQMRHRRLQRPQAQRRRLYRFPDQEKISAVFPLKKP